MSNLVLVGFKMSGKTTYGRALAAVSGRQFLDIDDMMVAAHRRERSTDRAAFEIYRDLGRDEYHRFERDAVAGLADISNAVVSTAGSTALHEGNVSMLRRVGAIAMIDAPRETVRSRWFSGRLPQFLDPADPAASFAVVYEERMPAYRAAADFIVETAGRSIDQVVAELIRAEACYRATQQCRPD